MSINIIIAIDQDIHDPLTMGQTSIVAEIFRVAFDVLVNGGKVIVQRHYVNAPPDNICEFKTQDELSQWKERLNEAQATLNRDQIK